MSRITIDDLMSRLSDLSTEEADLAPFFIIDPDTEDAFSPAFTLNPETVAIPEGPTGAARSALALNLANRFARMRRHRQFLNRMSGGYSGPVIVAEGDSWWQYPLILQDVIDHLMQPYAIRCLSAAGDLLGDMAKKAEYMAALRDTNASILLMSGGGNDLLRRGQLANHLEAYHPDLKPADYLKRSFDRVLDEAFDNYERILRDVHGAFPHVRVLVHGYDYAIPNKGRWLGRPMERRGINDQRLQAGIAQDMMDKFNRGLRRRVANMPHVTYVDVRDTVSPTGWHDELHPKNEGYGAVAAKLEREIARLANRRSAPPVFMHDGPFGRARDLARHAQAADEAQTADEAQAGRVGGENAISLHVGLNLLDPAHYSGWDGALAGCENDAIAMERLARGQGFETRLLLTEAATRQAVIDEIVRAADALHPGDMFLFTMAGHGGRIPDWNGDEEDDGTGTAMDETLCLFDSQLVDDELYLIWSRFREGVRILYVGDTCHSGTPIRFNPFAPPVPDALNAEPGMRPRCMPQSVEFRTWRQNFDEYRSRSAGYAGIDERVLLNPLERVVTADVMSLGACQDHQYAMDGPEHGVFTAALLRVWDQGRYRGDYHDLRSQIEREISSPTQIPSLDTRLTQGSGFARQQPFTLWPKPSGAPLEPPMVPASSLPVVASSDDEGDEPDDAPATRALLSGGARSPERHWPEIDDFRAFVATLGLRHFAPEEFLVLGGSHSNPASDCHGRNTFPPRNLWPDIVATARVLDALRARLGRPITITNAYRSPDYNSCIGGASGSQHPRFTALDFRVSGLTARQAADALRWMRDREGVFRGGVGIYNSFVHVDTRGANATWWGRGVTQTPLPPSDPFALLAPAIARETTPRADRAALVRTIPLAAERRGGDPVASAFASAVPRRGDAFDLESSAPADQQATRAAVSGAGVVSFFDTLSPGQKEDVLLSTLFAQRAADHAHDPVEAREEWYQLYLEVLSWLGWARLADGVEVQQRLKSNGSFDAVVLQSLAAVASGNQLAIVTSALDALRALKDDDGAVRLFDLQSGRSTGSSFQIASAEASGADISMALGAYAFVHSDTRTKVLFVQWGRKKVDFWLSAQRLSLANTVYDDVRDVVKERLDVSRRNLIATIPLG